MVLQMKAAAYGSPDVIEAFDVEVPAPGPGEVTIEVRAAGVNPTDWKGITGSAYGGNDPAALPKPIGYEVAGVLAAVGPDTSIASGAAAVGDPVLAFRVEGGYAEALTVRASDVFAKPQALDFHEAANLLLAGTTAAQMLHVTAVQPGQTILVHGASSAVGVSVLQQAALMGVRVVGTASEGNFALVRRFDGDVTRYGPGLRERVLDLSPNGFAAALDCVGTEEAVEVSLSLVADPDHVVTIAAPGPAAELGFRWIVGSQPESIAYRNHARQRLIDLAASGDLVVPMARTFPLREAAAALTFLQEGHPGGKVALLP